MSKIMIFIFVTILTWSLAPGANTAPAVFSCTTITEIPQIECEALVALYTSTNGPGWRDRTNWLATNTPSNWYGITVTNGHVTRLVLVLNNMNGSLPLQIGNFSELTYFHIDQSNLSGVIPPTIGDLSHMVHIFLACNNLTGSIPSQIGQLSDLVELNFSGNQLSGAIPSEIGNLDQLTLLELSNNQLSGSLSPQIGDLSRLQSLVLNHNNLTGNLPTQLANLTTLRDFRISVNQFSGSLPPELGGLAQLEYMDISDNQFQGAIPLSFIGLTSLIIFSFNNTFLCEPPDPLFQAWKTTVGGWTGTGQICVENSVCVTGMAIPWEECKSLEAIFVSTGGSSWTHRTGWGVTQTPCSWYGVGCSGGHVTSLVLPANNLSGIIPVQIRYLQSLKTLNLSHNQITGNFPTFQANMPELEALDLHQNLMTGALSFINTLPEIVDLNLSNNQFYGFTGYLYNLSALQRLDLSNNNFETGLDGPLYYWMGNPVYINLSHNPMVGGIPAFYTELTSLTYFNIQDTLICEPQDAEFQAWKATVTTFLSAGTPCPVVFDCTQVTEIVQSECEALVAFYNSTHGYGWTNDNNWFVTNTPSNWYGVNAYNGHITWLMLGDNHLSGSLPPELGNFPEMFALRLQNNQITGSLPSELADLSTLSWLQLDNNFLSGSLPLALSEMDNLANLDLHNNALTGVIPSEYGNFSSLGSLDLSGNLLTGAIPSELGTLSTLRTLSLHGNQLTGAIPPEIGNLSSLDSLLLAGNPLSGSIPPEIGNLSNLRFMYLQYCGLTGSIPPQLGNLSELEIIWLNNNQLTGSIPPELGNLTQAIHLLLGNNQLSGPIPAEIGSMNALQVLQLSNNHLDGEIPSALASLVNLAPPGAGIYGGDGLDLDYNRLLIPAGYPISGDSLHDFLTLKDPNWHQRQAVEEIIDENGGSLTSLDGATTFTFPAGAVNGETTISYAPQPTPTQSTGALAFANLSFQVTALDAGGVPVTTCPGSSYTRLPETNTFSLPICHLSEFGLLGTHPIYLPFVSRK